MYLHINIPTWSNPFSFINLVGWEGEEGIQELVWDGWGGREIPKTSVSEAQLWEPPILSLDRHFSFRQRDQHQLSACCVLSSGLNALSPTTSMKPYSIPVRYYPPSLLLSTSFPFLCKWRMWGPEGNSDLQWFTLELELKLFCFTKPLVSPLCQRWNSVYLWRLEF